MHRIAAHAVESMELRTQDSVIAVSHYDVTDEYLAELSEESLNDDGEPFVSSDLGYIYIYTDGSGFEVIDEAQFKQEQN